MFLRRLLSLTVTISFVSTLIVPPQRVFAQTVLDLPAPGAMVSVSPSFTPALIKGLTVHKDNPFLFDFIVDPGDSFKHMSSPNALIGDPQQEQLKQQADRMIKYFFAALTLPDKDIWVNLSPYEKDRMVPASLGVTAMGRDLLAQDYMLKQLTASLINPQKSLGKTFWDTVYAKAKAAYGTTEIPVNTFNKVWIVPQRAGVYEHGQTAYIVSGHLKVMLEKDYLASKMVTGSNSALSPVKGQELVPVTILRQIIIPEIEREVNEGKNFATLRQIFYAQVLAVWFKRNLKQALLNQVYANKSTVKGIDQNDAATNDAIYRQYLQAYKKGVFNFIQDDPVMSSPNASVGDPEHATIPRKYFSGGYAIGSDFKIDRAQLSAIDMAQAAKDIDISVFAARPQDAVVLAKNANAAMVADLEKTAFGREMLREFDKAGNYLHLFPKDAEGNYGLGRDIRHNPETGAWSIEYPTPQGGSMRLAWDGKAVLYGEGRWPGNIKLDYKLRLERDPFVRLNMDGEKIEVVLTVEAIDRMEKLESRRGESFYRFVNVFFKVSADTIPSDTATTGWLDLEMKAGYWKGINDTLLDVLHEALGGRNSVEIARIRRGMNEAGEWPEDKEFKSELLHLYQRADARLTAFVYDVQERGIDHRTGLEAVRTKLENLIPAIRQDLITLNALLVSEDDLRRLNDQVVKVRRGLWPVYATMEPEGDDVRFANGETFPKQDVLKVMDGMLESIEQGQYSALGDTVLFKDERLGYGGYNSIVSRKIENLSPREREIRIAVNIIEDPRFPVRGLRLTEFGSYSFKNHPFNMHYSARELPGYQIEEWLKDKKSEIEASPAMTSQVVLPEQREPDLAQLSETKNKAMSTTPLGGIDLSQQDAALRVTRDAAGGVKVDVDPSMIARIEREGLHEVVPVIINMRPADIRSLFGIGNSI